MEIAVIIPAQRNSTKSSYREYPLGAGYLGTALKSKGYDVTIIDQAAENISNENVVNNIRNKGYEWALFSMVTSTYSNGLSLLRLLKATLPECRTVAGGVHPSLFPESTVRDGFDYVVKGEGESSVPMLIENEYRHRDYNIPGLYFKDGERIRGYEQGEPVPLDMSVDRALYNLPLYTHHTVCFFRGCPHGCKFCSDIFRGSGSAFIRASSRECIARELNEIDRLGGNVFFADDIFMESDDNLDYFIKIYRDNNLGFKWIAQLRADTVSEERVAKMAEYGCQRIYLGCESGSDVILRNAGKRITAQQIRTAIDVVHRHGLKVKTGWIYGLPGSIEEQYKSINLMLETRPENISIHMLIPFPGTHFFNKRDKYGIVIDDATNFDIYSYSGLNPSIRYDYLTSDKLLKLFKDTEEALGSVGVAFLEN